MTDTATILSNKIRAADGEDALARLDKAVTNHYINNTISLIEFKALDSMIFSRQVKYFPTA